MPRKIEVMPTPKANKYDWDTWFEEDDPQEFVQGEDFPNTIKRDSFANNAKLAARSRGLRVNVVSSRSRPGSVFIQVVERGVDFTEEETGIRPPTMDDERDAEPADAEDY